MTELTDMIGVEMPTVSRHLRQLKNVGIVGDEKRGAQVFYRLRVPCVLKFFQLRGSGAEEWKSERLMPSSFFST